MELSFHSKKFSASFSPFCRKGLCLFIFVLFSNFVFSLGLGIQKGSTSYPGGNRKSLYSYYLKDGAQILHGKYKELFTNGKIFKVAHFKHGKLNGKSWEYYPKGTMKWKGCYKEGVKVGKWILWDEWENKKMKAVFSKHAELRYILHYHSNGKRKTLEIYEKGIPVKRFKWDITGLLLSEKDLRV